MFHFGFSYIGLIYLIMLFVPNILWIRRKPQDYEVYAAKESKVLKIFERIGEVLVSVCVLIFSDFNIRENGVLLLLALSFALMILYELYWVRYFRSSSTMQDMYRPLLGIHAPGAALPVSAFGLLALYGGNGFLLVSVLILGIGHIGIHRRHEREVLEVKKPKKIFRILKGCGKALGGLVTVCLLGILLTRNIRYFSHFDLIETGVDEGIYVTLGGQEQYLLVRGTKKDNPVIIHLHGGPSAADTSYTNIFSDWLVDDYTVIAWDQRGCGRTYCRNQETDPENDTASFEQAQKDLDELVDYARKRFGQEKVILMGHSYGTLLGTVYAQEHPEKVKAYIGLGQVVCLRNGELVSYEDALKKAKAKGDDTSEMEQLCGKFIADPSIQNALALRIPVSKYHPTEPMISPALFYLNIVTSPYLTMEDAEWTVFQLTKGNDVCYYLERYLLEATLEYDLNERSKEYEVPMYFISGDSDWICPTECARKYSEEISAPEVEFRIIEGTGHVPNYAIPEKYTEVVKDLLQQRQQSGDP